MLMVGAVFAHLLFILLISSAHRHCAPGDLGSSVGPGQSQDMKGWSQKISFVLFCVIVKILKFTDFFCQKGMIFVKHFSQFVDIL